MTICLLPSYRLYSHYYHRCAVVNSVCDPAGFHQAVLESLEDYQMCSQSRPLRECVYDSCLNGLGQMGRMVGNIPN